MKFLGIDYGKAKIGLAISEGLLAEPFGIIKASAAPKRIVGVCREMSIQKIVIGISEGGMAEQTKKFAHELAKLTDLPIDYQDETLTSKEALAKMSEVGKNWKDEDAVSAALILQTYLDNQFNNLTT